MDESIRLLNRQFRCANCGLVYIEADGWPDEGIAPGTTWDDVPEDWHCPVCGMSKADFRMERIR